MYDYRCYFTSEEHEEHEDERFARSGSALRAVTKSNPRIHECPTCHSPNKLTKRDISRGYQCDECADRQEGGY